MTADARVEDPDMMTTTPGGVHASGVTKRRSPRKHNGLPAHARAQQSRARAQQQQQQQHKPQQKKQHPARHGLAGPTGHQQAPNAAGGRKKAIHDQEITEDLIRKATTMRQHSSEEKAHFFEKITNLSLHGRSIRNIRNLNMCTRLRVLFLYSNRIERIENLSFARNLTHLYLENNQISRIEDLTNLTQLTKLSLDGNRISKLEGLENCCSLLELHLSNQRLELGESLEFDPQSIAGLAGSLQLLTIANAQVESILPLAGLAQLQVLRASHNKFLSSDLAQAEAVLKGCTLLEEVDFAETPLAGAPDYRDTLIAKSEYIALIDCKPVQPNQRQFLQARARRRALGRASTSRLRASGANVAKGSTPSLSMDVVGSSTVDSGATRSSNQESQASLGSMLSQATYVTDATAFSHAAVPSRRHPLPMFHSSSATSKRAPHVPESEIEASFAGFLHTKPVSLSATK